MSIRSQSFSVTGSTTVDTFDDGIQSEAGQATKKLLEIVVTVDAYNGAIVRAVEGQTTKQEAYDSSFRSYAVIASFTAVSESPVKGFKVDRVLEVGRPYRIGVNSASTATSLRGHYIYEQADE